MVEHIEVKVDLLDMESKLVRLLGSFAKRSVPFLEWVSSTLLSAIYIRLESKLMKCRKMVIKTKIKVIKNNNLKKLLALRERINGTGYHIDKLGDDLQVVQKRLADILAEVENIIMETCSND